VPALVATVARRTLTLGTRHLNRRDLEELREAGRSTELRVLGLACIADDVDPELALATITAVGARRFWAPRAVQAALGPRTV